MAISVQLSVGASTPALLAAAAPGGTGPVGWFYLTNGSGGAIYLGGSGVTSSNGAQVAASTTLTGYLFPGDQLFAITATGSSAVGVLRTGA